MPRARRGLAGGNPATFTCAWRTDRAPGAVIVRLAFALDDGGIVEIYDGNHRGNPVLAAVARDAFSSEIVRTRSPLTAATAVARPIATGLIDDPARPGTDPDPVRLRSADGFSGLLMPVRAGQFRLEVALAKYLGVARDELVLGADDSTTSYTDNASMLCPLSGTKIRSDAGPSPVRDAGGQSPRAWSRSAR